MKILKIIFILITLFMLNSCSNRLKQNNWSPNNYKVLNFLIENYGSSSINYNKNIPPYCVFDFDNTTIIGDIEMSLMAYQFENLRFKIRPEHMFDAITSCLDSIDYNAQAFDNPPINVRNLALDISTDYKYLYNNYINDYYKSNNKANFAKQNLQTIKQSKEYLDFRAKLWTLSYISYINYSYRTGCLWILKLLNGMTKQELQELTIESTEYAMQIPHPHMVTWESPNMGLTGKVVATFPVGIRITKSMKDLYNCLNTNGIDAYICSASLEWVVEAVACNPKFGLNVPQERVFGLRLKNTNDGLINAELDPNYNQTYKQGKVDAIFSYIAPNYNNNPPLMTAGDSDGDYEMLTEIKDLKFGLIINVGNKGKIANLYKIALQADDKGIIENINTTRYMLQGRDPYNGTLIPHSWSVPFKH